MNNSLEWNETYFPTARVYLESGDAAAAAARFPEGEDLFTPQFLLEYDKTCLTWGLVPLFMNVKAPMDLRKMLLGPQSRIFLEEINVARYSKASSSVRDKAIRVVVAAACIRRMWELRGEWLRSGVDRIRTGTMLGHMITSPPNGRILGNISVLYLLRQDEWRDLGIFETVTKLTMEQGDLPGSSPLENILYGYSDVAGRVLPAIRPGSILRNCLKVERMNRAQFNRIAKAIEKSVIGSHPEIAGFNIRFWDPEWGTAEELLTPLPATDGLGRVRPLDITLRVFFEATCMSHYSSYQEIYLANAFSNFFTGLMSNRDKRIMLEVGDIRASGPMQKIGPESPLRHTCLFDIFIRGLSRMGIRIEKNMRVGGDTRTYTRIIDKILVKKPVLIRQVISYPPFLQRLRELLREPRVAGGIGKIMPDLSDMVHTADAADATTVESYHDPRL